MIFGITKGEFILNRKLLTAIANKVSDEDSIILFDILNKEWPEEKHDTIYAIALSMLEEVEGEEE
tara:strand:- start:1031 stop:1225 length:195 start_codon:yes stop_codon:yes gene_type:complete